MKRKKLKVSLIGLAAVVLLTMFVFDHYAYKIGTNNPIDLFIKPKIYDDSDFGLTFQKSELDMNQNGIDDYTDILLEAKRQNLLNPTYKSAYYDGGYPPDNEGVCTDLIWRALQAAGYDFKAMIDADIMAHPEAYPRVNGRPDPNIDFRRVANVMVFFERTIQAVDSDPGHYDQWQAGDIVIFGTNHMGIISDLRNAKGIPYLIHFDGGSKHEEDVLVLWNDHRAITGHYRFAILDDNDL